MINHAALGATMYVPCTHPDLLAIANGEKIPFVKSIILCTEDSVAECDVLSCLQNLMNTLKELQPSHLKCFIRVRNQAILKQILDFTGIEKIIGFVLPKITQYNFESYENLLIKKNFLIMPTLETAEVFDHTEMIMLRKMMKNSHLQSKILMLRIGGNDLFSVLGTRRPRGMTIYDTPIGQLIGQLVMIFKPHGFYLSAPVFEYLNDTDVLDKEVRLDLAYGLVGKTAIHPTQIAHIEKHYHILASDYKMAQSIVKKDAQAVFKMFDAMCEPATHLNWALDLINKTSVFNIIEDEEN